MADKDTKKDYKQLAKDKEIALKPLFDRMDNDRKLIDLESYVLKDAAGNPVPDSISVTLPDLAIFATNVESALGSSTEQVVVESDDKQLDTAYIEDFIRASFDSANAKLIKQGRWPLNPYFDQQLCRRGRAAARSLFTLGSETGELNTDIVYWDTRFTLPGRGAKGLEWIAYETNREKDIILAEHPGAQVSGKDADILDIYAPNHHELWIDDKSFIDEKTIYDTPPVALQLVPMGSMLADKDSLAKQGESILFLIRSLVPELDRLISIIQSLNMKALDNALTWPSKEGTQATPPSHRKLTKPGSITATDIGARPEPIAYGELKRSAYLLQQMIEVRIQRGSLSNLDLGIMGNQPWSAIALIEIGEGRDQVFLPRLGARGLLKEQLAEMFIEQVINLGVASVEIGSPGHKRSFSVAKLKGEYTISFKYFVKSPKIDAARSAMAQAQRGMIPDRSIRRDTLQREDPAGDERWLRWEEAERLSPAIKMNRTIQTLIELSERGDEHAGFEAELLSAEMGVNLQQMLSGQVSQQPKPEEAQTPEALMPMFEGGRSSAQKAADVEATPRAEEGE